MKVINLFAGPGAGKSTTAYGVSFLLKSLGVNCEYVTENAKSFTWEERHVTLACQPYLFAKQMRDIWRLKNKVDYVVSDSPLLLSLAYLNENDWPESFKRYVVDQFNSFNNINYFINRKKKYITTGRNQTYQESLLLDEKIQKILIDNGVLFDTIDGNEQASKTIVEKLKILDVS